jgi:hypothetical protein
MERFAMEQLSSNLDTKVIVRQVIGRVVMLCDAELRPRGAA